MSNEPHLYQQQRLENELVTLEIFDVRVKQLIILDSILIRAAKCSQRGFCRHTTLRLYRSHVL